MDLETCVDSVMPCRFIDETYGEWWTTPKQVKRGRGHPDRSKDQRSVKILSQRNKCMEELQGLIDSKGYKFVSGVYKNQDSPLVVICDNGHEHVSCVYKLKHNGCPACAKAAQFKQK